MATSVQSPYRRGSFLTLKTISWIVFAAMTLFVIATRERTLLDASSFLRQRYAVLPGMMWLHGLPGAIALLLGFLQFSTRIRQRHLQWHRVLGRIYVGAVAISAPAAMIVAVKLPTPHLTPAAFIQSFGWLACTGTALYCIRTKQIQQHREWMVRSYPFAMVFVVARVILSIPAVRRGGVDLIAPVVWTVLALACFLPSALIEWQKLLANKAVVRQRAAAAAK